MNKQNIFKVIISFVILSTIVVSILSNALPINGLTTKELSDAIQIYFVPEGYVFSIWGLIYLGLIIYAISIFKNFQKEDEKIFSWLVISCISNIAWLLLWHYQFVVLSTIPMVILLICLIAIYLITDKKGYGKIKRIPFQIYLGWISVASIANIAGALYVSNWNGFGIPEQIWAVVMIGVATKLSIMMTSCKRDYIYPIVIVWAVIGILIKFFSESDLITGASLISIIAIIVNLFANTYCLDKRKDISRS